MKFVNFERLLNLKIVVGAITVTLCLTSTVGYGVEVKEQGYLRVPLITSRKAGLGIEYEGVDDENQQVIGNGLTKELLEDALKVRSGRAVHLDTEKPIKVIFRRRMDLYTAYELKGFFIDGQEFTLGIPIGHKLFYAMDMENNIKNLTDVNKRGFRFAAMPYSKIYLGKYQNVNGQKVNVPFFLREYVPGKPAGILLKEIKEAPSKFNAVLKCAIEILVELYDNTGKVIDDKDLSHIVVDLVEDNGKFLARGKFVEMLNVRDIQDKASALLSILEYAPFLRNNPKMVYQAFIDICGRERGLDILLQFKKFLSGHSRNISYMELGESLDKFMQDSGYRIFEVKSEKDIDIIDKEVLRIAEESGFDEDSVDKIELAVVELATNINRYVKNRDSSEIKGYIVIEFISEISAMKIIARDFGPGFDVTDENIGVCPDPHAGKLSGRGLFLVIKSMDEGWISSGDKELLFRDGEKLPVRDTDFIQGTEVVAIKYLHKKDSIEALKYHKTILGEDAGKYLKTKVRWEIGDFGLIADVFTKDDAGYKFDVDARLVGVQLLSMLGVHHNTVREMLEKIVQEDVDETVRQKALSVLTSYVKIVIGTKRVIEIGDYKDIRKRAIDALNELREKGCYAAEVIFETHSEGNVESATFAVYSLTQGTYINLTETETAVESSWGNVKWLEDDEGDPVIPFAHIHIALTNEKGGHLQAINAKGTLTIRPLWGVCIGRDYEVVTDGRKFDPWKMREEKIPKGIRGQEGIVIRLNDDEDLVDKLRKIAKAEGIKKASFRAIGALDKTKDPNKAYQSSVTYINSKTGEEETRQVYHEYLAYGQDVDLTKEGEADIYIYLADENGRMELHRLVRLNNVALGEIVMEIIVGGNDRRDKGTDKGNFKTYRVPGRNGLRLAL